MRNEIVDNSAKAGDCEECALKEYALYKGDEFVMIGTIEEIAKFLEVKIASVKFMTSPTYKRRSEGKANRSILVDLGEEDEELESIEGMA